MRIVVNGESVDVDGSPCVADLLASLGMDARRVAVERNRQLVRRAEFTATAVTDGDVLEIVTLVGGG